MITASDLTKRFQGKLALDAISCEIPDGCIYGLVGANGAGKSTFLRLASGIYRPDAGSITIDGEAVYDNPSVKRRFTFVSDALFFLPQSNLSRMAKIYQASYDRFSMEQFRALMNRFDLDPAAPLTSLSKGRKRQAAMVLALSVQADYLFFDETFDGLDPVMRNLVRTTLYADVAERGATAIITSHSLRELEDTCDQLALLYQGGLVFSGEVESIRTKLMKVQVAFSEPFGRERFHGLDILHYSQHGSVASFIVRGERERVMHGIRAGSPLLLEVLPLTLEEIFVYEMEAIGYAFDESGNRRGEGA